MWMNSWDVDEAYDRFASGSDPVLSRAVTILRDLRDEVDRHPMAGRTGGRLRARRRS